MRKLFFKLYFLLRMPQFLFRKNSINISTNVGPNVLVSKCKIGSYNYIGRNSILNNVIIGNYCSIAPNVVIGGMEHSYWWYSTSTFLSDKCISNLETVIGHDVWIGANCIIKQGVTIGTGAVIGAHSFVNKDVEEYSIVIGCPAKVLKYRFPKSIQVNLINSEFWLCKPSKAKVILDNLNIEK